MCRIKTLLRGIFRPTSNVGGPWFDGPLSTTTTPTAALAPDPIAADPAGSFAAAAAAFLATWAGALDTIRPGDDCGEQIEGMADDGLIRVLDGLGLVRHITDVMAARLMGAVAERSRPAVGRTELTRQHGCANPTVLLAERWRIPRGQASTRRVAVLNGPQSRAVHSVPERVEGR
ncbi:MAG TPA: hypothetical protein VNJ54_19310 [Plantibacter sp.]|uniref:hypothetical protein n=1 Tax=unclassified Plantibacter TaxID=2624265 RepID=UPI002CC6F1D3|nr:hypothetical protein [Plantibacter sp.]